MFSNVGFIRNYTLYLLKYNYIKGQFVNRILRPMDSIARQKRCLSAVKKRFYKNVTIADVDGSYEVILDGRKLKTPLGEVLKIPNEALAVTVATEWDNQQKELDIYDMHITSLSNTAIDNPNKRTKENVVESILEFLENDTLCYRLEEPPHLAELQKEKWDPIINWFQERYHVQLVTSADITASVASKEAVNIMKKHLMSYSDWALVGFQYAVENLKSLVLACAVVDKVLDVESAVSLSRLEVEFQTDQWGKVEWYHDVELMQTRSRVSAAALFVYLNSESTHFLQKGSHSA